MGALRLALWNTAAPRRKFPSPAVRVPASVRGEPGIGARFGTERGSEAEGGIGQSPASVALRGNPRCLRKPIPSLRPWATRYLATPGGLEVSRLRAGYLGK